MTDVREIVQYMNHLVLFMNIFRIQYYDWACGAVAVRTTFDPRSCGFEPAHN